ncbi:MAG TPA: GDP-mannose 4,6-dehydratase [Candidatus Acidoferrales bacterium]|nr:GDP-mannose 4,6-dehydratase [Candidatus Acidoferrales bacterium]
MEIMVKMLKNENILVTGGTGFVGSHLIEELIKQKASIVTTYQFQNPKSYFFTQKMDKKVTLVNTNVCDYNALFHIVTKYDIRYIFHLAAQPLVDVAYYNPAQTIKTNIIGTLNILETARQYPHLKGIIITSSDKAYGKTKKNKYMEDDSLSGDHPYEVSKSAADLLSNTYFKTYNTPLAIVRFGNIYGEGDMNFSRLIPGTLKAIIDKEILEIRSDGTYIRDYLYVKDVIKGYIALMTDIETLKGNAFNFGSEETLSVLEVINKIESILKRKVDVKILKSAKNEIPHQSLDYAKVRKMLNWKQKYTFDKTIPNIYKYYNKLLT